MKNEALENLINLIPKLRQELELCRFKGWNDSRVMDAVVTLNKVDNLALKACVANRIFGAVIHTNGKTFERWLIATDEIDARMQILHKYPESASVVRELPAI